MTNEESGKPQGTEQTLTDDQIRTEPTLRRRSFLTAVGALVAGSAAVMASGGRALAAAPDPTDQSDQPKKPRRRRPDPDKAPDPDTAKRPSDPDKAPPKRPADPDGGK